MATNYIFDLTVGGDSQRIMAMAQKDAALQHHLTRVQKLANRTEQELREDARLEVEEIIQNGKQYIANRIVEDPDRYISLDMEYTDNEAAFLEVYTQAYVEKMLALYARYANV